MQTKRLIRAALLTAVWTYAAAVWASIAHHLLGLPDLVPVAAVAAAIATGAWSLRRRIGAPSPGPAKLRDRSPVTE